MRANCPECVVLDAFPVQSYSYSIVPGFKLSPPVFPGVITRY